MTESSPSLSSLELLRADKPLVLRKNDPVLSAGGGVLRVFDMDGVGLDSESAFLRSIKGFSERQFGKTLNTQTVLELQRGDGFWMNLEKLAEVLKKPFGIAEKIGLLEIFDQELGAEPPFFKDMPEIFSELAQRPGEILMINSGGLLEATMRALKHARLEACFEMVLSNDLQRIKGSSDPEQAFLPPKSETLSLMIKHTVGKVLQRDFFGDTVSDMLDARRASATMPSGETYEITPYGVGWGYHKGEVLKGISKRVLETRWELRQHLGLVLPPQN